MFGYFFCRPKHNSLCILRIQRFSPFITDSKNYNFIYSSHQSAQRWHGSHKAKSAPLLPSAADGQDLIVHSSVHLSFICSFPDQISTFFKKYFLIFFHEYSFFSSLSPIVPYALFSRSSSTYIPIRFFQMIIWQLCHRPSKYNFHRPYFIT